MERDIPCSCCDPSLPPWLAMPVVQYCSEGHDFTFGEITAMVLGKMMETTEAKPQQGGYASVTVVLLQS